MHIVSEIESTAHDGAGALPQRLQKCYSRVAAARIAEDGSDISVSRHNAVREALASKAGEEQAEDAFFVADLGEVWRQHRQWTQLLPRIQPFYAVKCNPDPLVVKLLQGLGAGFDCASKAELEQVLGEGARAEDVIYAHPCKPASHLRYAHAAGIQLMTFDNADELVKIKREAPDAKAVLRILADDSGALCRLGLKFGADPAIAPALLAAAQRAGVEVVGVSFHVGSGSCDANAFEDAVRRARSVFDAAEAVGMRLSLLDVGGGFPGNGDASGLEFATVAGALSRAIERWFPAAEYGALRMIAEPGRYFVSSAFTVAVNVIARRVVDGGRSFMYYVNDGVYGSFNCIMFDRQHPRPIVLTQNGVPVRALREDEPRFPSSIWGPTCDSCDCIVESCEMPELQVGDWLVFDQMGAYTISAASRFNGFRLSDVMYIDTERTIL